VEAHLRTRLLLPLFALCIALVACPTVENRSSSISGIVRLTPKRSGQTVQAMDSTGGVQPSSLTVAQVTGSSLNTTQFANIIPGRVIVKFKSGLRVQSVGPLSARVAGRSVNLEPQRMLGLAGVQLLRATGVDAKGTLELAAQLTARSDVEYAEPDRRIHALLTPNDTQYGQQWALGSSALGRLNVPSAWNVTTGSSVTGPNPVVAVVDSGVMLAHPDLASKILPGYDFISDPSTAADHDPPAAVGSNRDSNPDDPGDDELSFHGTHVSGIAAAIGNNRLGMAGVSWGARILPARILGVGGGTVSDMIDAVLWAAGIDSSSVPPAYPHNPNKADVINLSVGGGGSCSSAEQDAFNQVIAAGTAVVVAAGNEDVDAWTTDPASCAGLIVVGAVGRDGTRASYSNYGSRVSVMAPGGDKNPGGGILSTFKNAAGKAAYDYKIGTSMAAPHVAGVIALMRSLRPKLTPGQLEELLDTEADAVNCTGRSGCGVGLLDAGATLRFLKATSSVPRADFVLLPDHSVLSAPRGSSTISVSIRAAAFNGLVGPISLSVQASGGISAQLSASSIMPGSESTITFDPGTAPSGTYLVRVIGTAGGFSRSVQLLLPIPGTLVSACYLNADNSCNVQKSASIKLELNDAVTVAPYLIDRLQPGSYVIQAWKDSNNNGRLDSGDLYGESRTGITPPSENVDVTLSFEQ
jgi:serine protease